MADSKCDVCGERIVVVERATTGGYVEVLVSPSESGTMMRLPSGPDAGKYVELGGPVLDRARAEGSRLHAMHACIEGGLF